MRKLQPGILFVAIVTLASLTAQVAMADSHKPSRIAVVVVNRPAVSESDDVALTRSFLGLATTLRGEDRIAFLNVDEPTEFLGPEAAGNQIFKSILKEFESRLVMPRPAGPPNLVAAMKETHNMLSRQNAKRGSTVYLVDGGAPNGDLATLANRLAPMIALFKEKDWPIVGLALPGSSDEVRGFLGWASAASGGETYELSVPEGFKSLTDGILRNDAKGSLAELSEALLSPDDVLTSTVSVAPGTDEATLLFFKQSEYGSLRLSNPSGYEASAGDRTVSIVVDTPHVVIWRLIDPAPGKWKVDVRGVDGVVSAWHYAASKYSPALESYGAVAIDQPSTLVAYVTDGAKKVTLSRVTLQARITAPDETTAIHEMNDNGISGDPVRGDGYFTATIPPVAMEGVYKVDLELAWPKYDHRVSAPASFRAEPFPAIELTPMENQEQEPGVRSKVAIAFVNVQGQPYAVLPAQLALSIKSSGDQGGKLEMEPRRRLGDGRSWEFDVFFTPAGEGVHTIALQLSVEYAGRGHSHTSPSMVFSSIGAPVPPPPMEAQASALLPELPTAPKPTALVMQAPPPQPETDSAGFPWRLLAISLGFASAVAAGGAYLLTRKSPHGYLYNDRNEVLVDFSNLKRRPLMRLLFKNLVRGKELGVPGLEGVWFRFSHKRIGFGSSRATPSVRVNNQPVLGQTTIRDRTWIGTHGRLFSFLLSPSVLAAQPEGGNGDN